MFRDFALAGVVVFTLTVIGFFQPQFFDPVSLLITCGGALMVTGFSYSKSQLRNFLVALRDLLATKATTVPEHIEELRRLTDLFRRQGLRGLESQERRLSDRYLGYGVELLLDLCREEKIRSRMEHRRLTMLAEHEINRQILTTLGKLLPSFGLIGTLIGMVLLLSRVSALEPKGLPAALGLAVLTTLYGAVLANVLVLPLLARLQSAAVEKENSMNLTKEWILMIARGETAIIGEHVRATLLDTAADRLQEWEPLGVALPR